MDEKEVAEYVELVDELQKERIGNSNNLIEIKEMLVKNKGLDEGNLQYLTELDIRLDRKHHGPIITTTESIQGKEIVEYLGTVSGYAIIGMGVPSEFFGVYRDILGGRSSKLESYFLEAKENAIDSMYRHAIALGADAIIAVRFNDTSVEGKGKQMALVSIHGTAVRIKSD